MFTGAGWPGDTEEEDHRLTDQQGPQNKMEGTFDLNNKKK
jgi:hypothetical protein